MKKKGKNATLQAQDILAALGSVTKEKSISIELILDTLKEALTTAAKKYLGKPTQVEVIIDKEKGVIEVYTRQTVVGNVTDPQTQIHIDEAKRIDPQLEIGDELIQDMDIDLFGRMAIQTAKQVIIQRMREAEREKIFAEYSERIGELVSGTVQQIDKGNILINLGRAEAILPYKEQIHKERYHQGNTIRACIIDVKNNAKGPQIIVSRTCPEFLARLFEIEVPEINDKTVQIVKVVRNPGYRSKIAVTTRDERVDPVGACVGMRGNRVQAIVRELSNERIDIINWTDELSLLVRRVFAPAEVKKVIPVGDKKIVVVIKNEDLAQAIGKEGQNIRLASKMLDKEIDVYAESQFNELTDEQKAQLVNETQSGILQDTKTTSVENEDVSTQTQPTEEQQQANQSHVEVGTTTSLDTAADDSGHESKDDFASEESKINTTTEK